jgi:glycosyltransferase involved in cell wall biosynthesis
MKTWMVTGCHDRRWLDNVVANYARQTRVDKHLIIVENGGGIGAALDCVALPGVVVLQSEPGPAQPLNAALAWLREHASPADWFCKADSDDYYGPGYLESIQPAIDEGLDYAGRSSLYIRTTEDRLWYVEGKPAHVFHGPTIAARIGSALDFPLVRDWGEDAEWCLVMQRAGKSCVTLPPEHVCYQRHAGHAHTWPVSDLELRGAWPVEFIDLGPFDARVVDGTIPRPPGTSLGVEPLSPETFMPFRVLREQLGVS